MQGNPRDCRAKVIRNGDESVVIFMREKPISFDELKYRNMLFPCVEFIKIFAL